jgi:hypothetical protein
LPALSPAAPDESHPEGREPCRQRNRAGVREVDQGVRLRRLWWKELSSRVSGAAP